MAVHGVSFPMLRVCTACFPRVTSRLFMFTYLYNYAGRPWKTQYRIRQVLDLWFSDSPLGLPGDEDGGAMCTWYVFSAMGFIVTPGTGLYAIRSPFFDKVEIELPDGKKHSPLKRKTIRNGTSTFNPPGLMVNRSIVPG